MASEADLDELTGKEVTKAYALLDPETNWIVHTVFQVEELYLVITIEPDLDEVIIDVLTAATLATTINHDKLLQKPIANQKKSIAYIWRLTNQRGYQDGVQIEFDDFHRLNVQVMAEGSRLLLTVFNRT
ncbi:hypothetical protein FVR03_02140 [Pontibacter qinzhouensis]|uniref:Uncharacterized protein n=1 Tax=Pontibacter qinzhouensis TaxID=2603253 RepID=A0A5C8KCU4_9BACT|nr:DUF6334 family protein [Pontibacter qinzhouensis]TXK52085.1 hypothetical protein FVR03_02140 [Pontibacter qinzhouensis]